MSKMMGVLRAAMAILVVETVGCAVGSGPGVSTGESTQADSTPFQILNIGTDGPGGVAAVAGSSSSNVPGRGAAIVNWTNNGLTDKFWSLEPVGARFQMRNFYTGLCIGVGGYTPGSVAARGAQLVQWDCNGAADKRWGIDSNGQWFTDANPSLCVGVQGWTSGPQVGAPLILWDCNGTADKQWIALGFAPT